MPRVKKENVQDSSYWLFRPLNDEKRDWNETTDNWINDYWESRNHPHRKLIANAVAYSVTLGAENLLEIGCNCGPNISVIREKVNMRDDDIYGVDINKDAIEKAKQMLPAVNWIIGDVMSLPFPDQSFDTVLCDAVLMYVKPEEIDHIINEIDRVARKAVVLLEWDDESLLGVQKNLHWARDYAKMLERRGFDVEKIKITEDVWPNKSWIKLGILYKAIRK